MADEQDEGLDDAAIEQETAVPPPEREAMSRIDPAQKLLPISEALTDTGQGIDEKVIPE